MSAFLKQVLVFLLLLPYVAQSIHAQNNRDSSFFRQQIDSIIILDSVNVEAYQISGRLRVMPGNLSVLTGKEITISDGTNLAAALNTIPGVSMHSGTYTTSRIVIRGMGSRTPYNTNRIRSYLNDIPLTSSDGVSTPEEIDLQSIGRLELLKGPSSALYGSGLGGSINLYTSVNSANQGNVLLQYGNYNTSKFNISGTYHRNITSIMSSISHIQSDGYRENNHYNRTSVLIASDWKKPLGSIGFTGLLMGVEGGIPSSVGKSLFNNDPQAAAPNWKAISGYKKYLKGILGITFTNKFSEQITNRLTLFVRLHNSYEKRPFNNLDDRTRGAGLRNKLSLHFDKTDWVLGAEWIAEEYLWKLDTNNSIINQNRENRNLLNVFAMVYYRPDPKINISLAGAINRINYRLTDLYGNNGDQTGSRKFPVIVSPRIGINYAPYSQWAIYASAGHGFSMPSPEEALLPEGNVNPDIKPEQGMQFELGSRLNFFDGIIGLDGTLYWIELNNLLVTKRISEDIFTGVNAGKTRHQGFELMIQSRIFGYSGFPGKLNSIFSYTRSWNRFIEFTDDGSTYDGNHLPGIPNQMLNLQLEWTSWNFLEMNMDMRYTGDQFLNDDNTLEYAGYFIGNLKVSAHIHTKKAGKLGFYAGINNITGTRYASMLIVNARGVNNSEPRYYYPGLPRNAYGGIQFQF